MTWGGTKKRRSCREERNKGDPRRKASVDQDGEGKIVLREAPWKAGYKERAKRVCAEI